MSGTAEAQTALYKTPALNIAVILVNWRRAEDTIACIKSLICCARNTKNSIVDIAVVDNCSPDKSFALLKAFLDSEFSRRDSTLDDSTYLHTKSDENSECYISLFLSPSNTGFAGGNNYGIKQLKNATRREYNYFWLLNNDTEVIENCLQEMIDKFQGSTQKMGVCGSTMIYFHDKKTIQALGGACYSPLTGSVNEIGNGQHWPLQVEEAAVERVMSYVCGASMLASAQFISDAGLMQEDYFLFYEEIDWCTRAKKLGYTLGYASKAVVYHKEGASIGTGVGAKRSLLAEYYGMRNKLKVTRRFFPWALPTVWLIGWAQVARRAMQGRIDNAKIMAQVLCGLGRAPR